MKAVGVEPDLASYNALLKSCADAGDVNRASEVLNQIRETEELEPNDKTWREVIRAAGKAGRVDIALSSWKAAVEDIGQNEEKPGARKRKMSIDSLGALLAALVRCAGDDKIDKHTRLRLYQLVVKIYESAMSGSSFLGMNLVEKEKIVQNTKVMVTFLQAVVSLERYLMRSEDDNGKMDPQQLRQLATSIATSDCFEDGLPHYLQRNPSYATAFKVSRSWLSQDWA
jgi:pentatricopeptide repeat protein